MRGGVDAGPLQSAGRLPLWRTRKPRRYETGQSLAAALRRGPCRLRACPISLYGIDPAASRIGQGGRHTSGVLGWRVAQDDRSGG